MNENLVYPIDLTARDLFHLRAAMGALRLTADISGVAIPPEADADLKDLYARLKSIEGVPADYADPDPSLRDITLTDRQAAIVAASLGDTTAKLVSGTYQDHAGLEPTVVDIVGIIQAFAVAEREALGEDD